MLWMERETFNGLSGVLIDREPTIREFQVNELRA